MRKVITSIIAFSASFSFIACGGGSSQEPVNEAPSSVNLEYPTENLLCIDNSIPFDWSNATDANNDAISYKIEVATDRSLTNIVKTQTVNSSDVTIALDKGVAHYWRVTAVDSKGKSGEPSSVFAFYTKGTGETNTVPFTAELGSPANDAALAAGTVSLNWSGADSDTGDTLKYDLFFSEDADPAAKESDLTTTNSDVTVESGKTYYWKVNTIDAAGAKSIGQVWSFTVN